MADQLEGKHLGKYRLIEVIGRGSHGVVYLGHDPFVDRPVAVKVALGSGSGGRFFVEAQMSAGLQHPHITTVYDAGSEGDFDYIVTELVPHHQTLAAYCEPANLLEPGEVVRILAETADALAHAHGRGVLHRDIKPRNILLDPERRARLTDFGLALPASASGPGWMSGSPAYMAPELMGGAVHSMQSDIYALGVVLFELLTGALPFPSPDLATYRRAVTRGRALPLKHFRPEGLPPILQMIVDRCLVKRPEKRYRQAADLVGDLAVARDFLAPAPVRRIPQRQLEQLRTLPVLGDASSGELVALVQSGAWRKLEPGQSLQMVRSLESRLLLLVEGSFQFDAGKQHWRNLSCGSALLVSGESPPQILAVTRCQLLVLEQARLERLSERMQIKLYRQAALTVFAAG